MRSGHLPGLDPWKYLLWAVRPKCRSKIIYGVFALLDATLSVVLALKMLLTANLREESHRAMPAPTVRVLQRLLAPYHFALTVSCSIISLHSRFVLFNRSSFLRRLSISASLFTAAFAVAFASFCTSTAFLSMPHPFPFPWIRR